MSRSDLLEAVGAVLAAPAPEDAFVTRHSIAESRKRLQVLVAEDNQVNQEVAATMLRKRGHDVDVANNGREAVDAAARKRYDVVLMDIQMPEMDGFEATHAIRATEDGRTLPIIALTAHALSGERERCLAQGMSGYLTKPFKAHELFAVVEGWANSSAIPVPTTTTDSPPHVPTAAPVDLEAFRHEMRAAGAEDAVDPVLDTFLQTAPDRVAALTTALASGAGPEIERAAHAFKSASATIGAKGLATLLQELEVAGKAGDVNAARRVGDGLMRESEAVIAYLRQVRAPVNAGALAGGVRDRPGRRGLGRVQSRHFHLPDKAVLQSGHRRPDAQGQRDFRQRSMTTADRDHRARTPDDQRVAHFAHTGGERDVDEGIRLGAVVARAESRS